MTTHFRTMIHSISVPVALALLFCQWLAVAPSLVLDARESLHTPAGLPLAVTVTVPVATRIQAGSGCHCTSIQVGTPGLAAAGPGGTATGSGTASASITSATHGLHMTSHMNPCVASYTSMTWIISLHGLHMGYT